ncbi:IclR family transcriptional regulator [Sphaerisporangium melleum]|uniref:Glycerol operon regulatory protein n=1 Tax=Sphaerisporangium melleum TaxID=321316 RepID=A0A917RQC2_9ACTN|nr:IclR family transcriptional regulator C-terminal domain-containing protein [Sphaerisporangium melleum]GGL17743.1 IclR family transcriptional regulator [Sphaerisporangium melleum]GII74828.1 IclR family transcriptional regulator [Sphaerisporangium melleum]
MAEEFVQSLARGLAVIRAFDAAHPELTLSEVARATGLTRAAARRFLLTLVELGYVRTDGRLFALSPRVLELGYAYLSSLSLPEVALPHLERLVAEVHESASVSVLDATDIVYVARVPTTRIMRVTISIGTRFPAHCTSMGRVLLTGLPPAGLDAYFATARLERRTSRTITSREALVAELERVREQGWAMVDQELEEGLRSIAAPIRDRGGRVVAAVNLSSHASRTTVESAREDLLPSLLAAAARIEADLHTTDGPHRTALPVT